MWINYLKGQSFIMEIKKLLKKLLNSTCIIFTVVTAAYMLVLKITNITDADAGVEAGRVLLFFIFSFLLSIANALMTIDKIHIALRYALHYIITVFGFWTCFCLPNKMNASRTLVGIIIFSVAYVLIMCVKGFFSKRLNKLQK